MAELVDIDAQQLRDAAENCARAWGRAFDPGDPPCPSIEVIEATLRRWLTRTCEGLLEEADWYLRNSDHADGGRLHRSLDAELVLLKQGEGLT